MSRQTKAPLPPPQERRPPPDSLLKHPVPQQPFRVLLALPAVPLKGKDQHRLPARDRPAPRALQFTSPQTTAQTQTVPLWGQCAKQQPSSLSVEPHLVQTPPIVGPNRLHAHQRPLLPKGQLASATQL